MADLDQDNKLLEDQEEKGPPCLLTRAGRDCRGDRYGAVACFRCGWNPKEHQRRVRLPLVEMTAENQQKLKAEMERIGLLC